MVGDLTGSLSKKAGNEKGENAGIMDMMDFIIGALILQDSLFHNWKTALMVLF